MRILIKPGVFIKEVNTQFFHACLTVDYVWGEYGVMAVLTSGAEGKHMTGSLHPEGKAWDFRLWNLPAEHRKEAVDKIRENLNAKKPDYDVLLEEKVVKDKDGKDVKTVWMHIEYQPHKEGT